MPSVLKKAVDKNIESLASKAIYRSKESARQKTYPKEEKGGSLSVDELQRAFRMDEIVLGIVHIYTTAIIGSGYDIIGPEKKSVDRIKEFLNDINFNLCIREIVRDAFVFGKTYFEMVKNDKGTKYVNFVHIDPNNIEIKKNGNTPILDEWNKPKKFVYRKMTGLGKTDKVILNQDEIAYMTYFTLSGTLDGYAPVETVYNSITWKKNVEWSMGEGAHLYAAPPIIVKLGSPERFPSQDYIDNVSRDIGNIGPNAVLVFPYDVEVDRLEASRGMSELSDFADYFSRNIAIAMMYPPQLLGIGNVSGRSIERIAEQWELMLTGFQTIIADQLREEVFAKICDLENLRSVPRIEWKSTSGSIKLSAARRLATLMRSGLLTWDPMLENYVRRIENIPPMGKEAVQRRNEDTKTSLSNMDEIFEAMDESVAKALER